MNKLNNLESRMNILHLTWPILIEHFLRILIMNVDVFMLSFYSERAVAAVGLITQLTFFVMILFFIVSNGAGIVMSQFLGANKHREAGDTALASLNLMFVFSVVLSIVLILGSNGIFQFYKLDADVEAFARQYWIIFSMTSVGQAFNIGFATILRTYGYSRYPMYINMGANVLNVVGNYCFLFGPFGIPVLGVTGVAISTAFSRAVGAMVMLLFILRKKNIKLPFGYSLSIPKKIYRSIIAIGVPTSGEMLSYNTAQLMMIKFITIMGTTSLAACTYTQNIGRFIFTAALAVGSATQILSGYLVGGGRYEEAYKRVNRYFKYSFLISFSIVLLVAFFRLSIIGFFTEDPAIIKLVSRLLLLQIFLETGRVFNLIYISAMKGAGDVMFPFAMGVVSMWGISVFLAWFLGLHIGIGILGVWIGIASDEWFRGIVMAIRWKKGSWREKRLAVH